MSPAHLTLACWGFAVMRMLIGIAPFVASGPLMSRLRFPAEHDNPSARLMARFFGVRDFALGVLVLHFLGDLTQLRWCFLFNAACDAGDVLSAVIPVVRRQGIDRAALLCGSMGATGGLGWIVLYTLTG